MVALHSVGALAEWGVHGPVEVRVGLGRLRGSGCPGRGAWPVLAGRRRRRSWASLSSLEASSGIFTASTPGSSSSGESLDPVVGSGGGVVFNVVPLFGAPS